MSSKFTIKKGPDGIVAMGALLVTQKSHTRLLDADNFHFFFLSVGELGNGDLDDTIHKRRLENGKFNRVNHTVTKRMIAALPEYCLRPHFQEGGMSVMQCQNVALNEHDAIGCLLSHPVCWPHSVCRLYVFSPQQYTKCGLCFIAHEIRATLTAFVRTCDGDVRVLQVNTRCINFNFKSSFSVADVNREDCRRSLSEIRDYIINILKSGLQLRFETRVSKEGMGGHVTPTKPRERQRKAKHVQFIPMTTRVGVQRMALECGCWIECT